jgi:hypothetical protein
MRVKKRAHPAQELRASIDRLPPPILVGVIEGLERREIIAGEHDDGDGGVCPMMAAEVRWESVDRTSLALAQQVAWAWDRFVGATRSGRRASARQLLALRAMLEGSLLQRPDPGMAQRPDGGPAQRPDGGPAQRPVPAPRPRPDCGRRTRSQPSPPRELERSRARRQRPRPTSALR